MVTRILSDEVLLSVCSEVQIVCIWPSCIHKPRPLSPHLNPDWFYLWYQLTQLVWEKRVQQCSTRSCHFAHAQKLMRLLTLGHAPCIILADNLIYLHR